MSHHKIELNISALISNLNATLWKRPRKQKHVNLISIMCSHKILLFSNFAKAMSRWHWGRVTCRLSISYFLYSMILHLYAATGEKLVNYTAGLMVPRNDLKIFCVYILLISISSQYVAISELFKINMTIAKKYNMHNIAVSHIWSEVSWF